QEQRKFAIRSLHEVGFASASLEKSIGNVVWDLTFGITLDFDNEILPKFRLIQQALLPLLGCPLMMFVELFPFLRKLDFLFGYHIKRLQALIDEGQEMIGDAIKITEKSFDPHNQPHSYVDAFLREMKKNKETGKPAGVIFFISIFF
ncbi:hypothetical protein PENTCL1PPCAC_16302, partial [Pristionchus entomophagus]